MTVSNSAKQAAELHAEVLERVKKNRDRDLLAFYNEEDQCSRCGAPIYGQNDGCRDLDCPLHEGGE